MLQAFDVDVDVVLTLNVSGSLAGTLLIEEGTLPIEGYDAEGFTALPNDVGTESQRQILLTKSFRRKPIKFLGTSTTTQIQIFQNL
jgi:hypothetical protein